MRIKLKPLLKKQAKPARQAKAPRRDSLRYILQLFRHFLAGQQRLFGLALLMLIAEAVTAIFEAYPLAYLIDYLKGDRLDLLTYLGWAHFMSPLIVTVALLTVAMIGMAMINSFGDSLAEIYLAQVGRTLGYNLRAALYKHLQGLSLAFHDQRRTGDILTRVTGDVSEVEDFIIGSLSDIIGSLLVLIGTLAYLFYQSWEIGLVAALMMPLMAVVSNYFARQIKVATKQQRAREGDLATAAQEMLSSIRVIQTYSQGDHELKRFAEVNERNAAVALQTAKLQARFSWVMKVLEALAIAGVVWLGLWLIHGVQPPAITVGTLVLFIDQIRNMFKPTRKIIKEWNTIGKIYASVERIGELLDRQPAVSNRPNAVAAPAFRGHIELQAVSFAYQPISDEAGAEQETPAAARPVLNGVSFTATPGEVLALVGQTGAGKSTIIQLLPRLYDPSAGRILIDGADIRDFTLESLRSQISVVLQETVLFTGTVAENIAYGRTGPGGPPPRAEIIEAAIQANAHGFIEQLPQGYDTILGERGANLSGGQRQRLAIARAFIRNAPILILDEPTTGLDPESSELVLLALRLLMRGKTTIIISHDFKLVRQANQIVVLAAGRIEQMGTHRELLESGGTYANLYIKQFGPVKAHEEQPENVLYDLLQSPAFQYKWPAVQSAFDATAMQTHLQKAFFGTDEEASAYTIVQCKPGKASYLDGEGCLLRYEIQLQQRASGATTAALLLARLFADQAEAAAYLHGRLAPLATKLKGRPEIAPFAGSPLGPLALIDELNMVVSVFPLDGELPALIAATDRQRMAQFFDETLPETDGQRFVVEACTIDAGHYGRQHRCVLRYTVDGHWVDAKQQLVRPESLVVYGKVAADDRCKVVGMALNALHWHMARVKSSRRFVLPRIVGYQPKLRLIMLEAIPGTPRIPQLIQAQLAGKAEPRRGALTLTQALHDCAQVAAALHQTVIKVDKPRTFADELAYLQGYLPATQEFSLALAMQLQHALRRLQRYAEQTEPLPLTLSHGDFTYTQLLFDEESCGLVDFDTVCEAEPALDLGQFLAYLRLAAHKAQKSSTTVAPLAFDELCEHFISTYLQAADYPPVLAHQLRARVAAYEMISLMRIALHSWQKLKGSRLELVLDLLEERIECLPKAIHKTNTPPPPAPKVRKAPPAKPFRLAKPATASPPGLPQP